MSSDDKRASASDDEEDIVVKQFKVILLGDGAVGKTSIANRFSQGRFSQSYKQTVGVDFFMHKIQVNPRLTVALQLWDIGGQSIGSKMIGNYIAGAHAVLLCYDITNYDSFVNLEDWLRLVVKAFPASGSSSENSNSSTSDSKDTDDATGINSNTIGRMPYLGLIGNKNDLRHMCAVRQELHNDFAAENALHSFLVSAKSGEQVNQAFMRIAAQLAGCPITRADVDVAAEVIQAQIIDYERNDMEVNGGELMAPKRSGCTLS